ncbi:MAG: hypothetical protein ACE5MI_08160 [Acidimicrobiia bacterium]
MPISLTPNGIEIDHLVVDDAVVRDLLQGEPAPRRDELVARAISVGARGVMTMGLGLDLAALDATVHDSVSSAMSRAVEQLGGWRESFLASFDPGRPGSHTARFVEEIDALVGRGGALETWLGAALDPHSDETALGRLGQSMRERLDRLGDLIVEERGRKSEAERGTRKGFQFEDVVEEQVRATARHLGAIVERTSRTTGEMGLAGDLTVALQGGDLVVIEVKDQARIALTGRESILDELERAMTNRQATFAVCVSARDAYPTEVGGFANYGNKVLVTDPGDGTMIDVALRWAAAALAAAPDGSDRQIDPAVIVGKLQEIRSLAQLFSSNRRSLTEIGRSVESVRTSMGEMRGRLIALTEELLGDLRLPASGEVVELHRAAKS